MATRKRYTKAFKDEACKLVREQKQDIAAAAAQPQPTTPISHSTVR